jgi:hypothetical protein
MERYEPEQDEHDDSDTLHEDDEDDEAGGADEGDDQAAPDLDALFARLRQGQGQGHGQDPTDDVSIDDDTYGDAADVVIGSPGQQDVDPTGTSDATSDGQHSPVLVQVVASAGEVDRRDESDPGSGTDVDIDDDPGASRYEPLNGRAPGEHDLDLLRQRDQALSTIEHDMARLLKRALADEQNEMLDLLRRAKPSSADDLLPSMADHAERYADAARDELEAAANCGAIHLADAEEPQSPGFCDALAAELSHTIVEPLRERITRSFADTGGDLGEVTGRLRALYREWKDPRITDAVRHYSVAAYAHGAYAALADGAPLRWLVDRDGDPCPDAEDNALAGAVCKGEAFPTGDHCPPAHLGCRCLVVSADR